VDIAAWLRELGLERYEPAFRENEIDWEVLPELTEGDLEKLGLPLGPRKKLLKALAGLPPGRPALATYAAMAPSPGAPEAERRQLTVMFADLVGSTALAARLDPEETRDVIRAYQDAVAGAVARFGGHIAKFMGDGVLCYFGWPTAHEDAAERAVHAGLAIVAAVERLPIALAETLSARVGAADRDLDPRARVHHHLRSMAQLPERLPRGQHAAGSAARSVAPLPTQRPRLGGNRRLRRRQLALLQSHPGDAGCVRDTARHRQPLQRQHPSDRLRDVRGRPPDGPDR
jgi:SAM domain (Sterile alpha motif)/Adenylate and Guanylate cyclase catalytic domain